MKIGILSDIHGEHTSLLHALDIFQQHGVEQIICAGDLVDKGTDGDGVIQLIQELNIPCVRGNHDEMAIDNQRWLRENADFDNPNAKKRLLSEDSLDYLRLLPLTRRFEWGGIRVLLAHGTPQSNVDYLFPQSPSRKFKTIARESNAHIIIFGHTHQATHAKFMGVHFCNPGSVYKGRTRGSHTCGILTLPDCIFDVWQLDTKESVSLPIIT